VPQDHGLVSALRTLSKHYVRTIIIIINKNTCNTTVKCKPSPERIMLHECIAGAYKTNLH